MFKNVLGMNISLGKYSDFINNIVDLAQKNSSHYICVANVHMLIEAYNSPSFVDVVNNADLVTPDGMPLTWAIKLVHGVKQDRVAGMDLLPDLIGKAGDLGLPVFFYGGTQDMLDKTSDYLYNNFPNTNIVGFYSPPFRPLTSDEEFAIVNKINDSGARLVFVALGCPKQEKWMASMKDRINSVMIGIGGALPVMVGMQKRAPKWMQNASLEWLFRLMQEPKRLFKRYAKTNLIFLMLLFKELFKKKYNY